MDKSIHSRIYQRIIARLRTKREEKGISQKQLGDKTGYPQSYISKIETCERRMDVLELIKICEALDISFLTFVKEIDEDIVQKFKAGLIK